MKKLLIAFFLIFIVCFGMMAQQKVYKIKPIKGKKGAVVQNQDLGYGMAKWSVLLERLGKTTEIYLPSDVTVFTEEEGYNLPTPSNSLKIKSTKTADDSYLMPMDRKTTIFKFILKKVPLRIPLTH